MVLNVHDALEPHGWLLRLPRPLAKDTPRTPQKAGAGAGAAGRNPEMGRRHDGPGGWGRGHRRPCYSPVACYSLPQKAQNLARPGPRGEGRAA